ncbi:MULTISPECIES: hypothetical protein [Microbacterium]|uniref:hypothetical protein n=1 Tax=Microbacterium TaxID=33882 RepID=UPI00217CD4F9|nr:MULTISPECIES: hypothetical protein [Microbacterium]UWF77792.1 hypothetical protein JSY13_01605 [Microbacterium neungamense]WCM55969.1 hypothetical protein JRG78_01640 [Microbacterium sp. EF45047]
MVLADLHQVAAEALPALQQLPTRITRREPDPGRVVRWERVASERYVVCDGDRIAGFVDVVGAVFVVLHGERYDRATEIGQTLVFADAVAALTR